MSNEIEKKLTEILASLHSLENRVTGLESRSSGSSMPGSERLVTKKLSIREFLKDRAPHDGVQTTLAIAYYVEHHEGTSPFNKVDLEKGFRTAKEQLPKNISDKIGMCAKNGHLMESETKKEGMKAWVLTASGEEYVLGNFSKS